LVIGFVGPYNSVTTSSYSAIADKHTIYSSVEHTLLSLLSLRCLYRFSGNGFLRRTFCFLWVPELSPSSATSFPQQHLTTTELVTNSVTHQPTISTQVNSTDCPAYDISTRTAQKTLFLFTSRCLITAVG
jgi:hypothetical protein